MSRYRIITIAIIIAVIVVAVTVWVGRPASLAPSVDRTRGIAPQAMLWSPESDATAAVGGRFWSASRPYA